MNINQRIQRLSFFSFFPSVLSLLFFIFIFFYQFQVYLKEILFSIFLIFSHPLSLAPHLWARPRSTEKKKWNHSVRFWEMGWAMKFSGPSHFLSDSIFIPSPLLPPSFFFMCLLSFHSFPFSLLPFSPSSLLSFSTFIAPRILSFLFYSLSKTFRGPHMNEGQYFSL